MAYLNHDDTFIISDSDVVCSLAECNTPGALQGVIESVFQTISISMPDFNCPVF